MINSEWTASTIGGLFNIGSGVTMSAAGRAGSDRTPFLRTSNVLWDEIDLSVVDHVNMGSTPSAAKLLERGDLLVCEGGDIGRAAIWTGERAVMSFQNHLHRLRPRHPDVIPQFYVYYLWAGFSLLDLFRGAGNDTTIPNLSRNRLASLPAPKPSYSEQLSITRALCAVRDAARAHRSALRVAEELKRTAMREVFSKGLRGEAQKETEIGLVPESWTVAPLSDLCTFTSGGTPSKSNSAFWSGDVPWVSGKDLKQPVLHDVPDRISEAAASASSKIAPADAVLILVRGMGLAKDLPISRLARPMAFNQDIKAAVSKGTLSGSFLRSAIYDRKQSLLGRIVPSAHGTMTLNLDDLETFQIAYPSTAFEADEIVATFDAIDAKIDLHRRKQAVLEELFRSLLQKLMTGEIRVADLDLTALADPPETECVA